LPAAQSKSFAVLSLLEEDALVFCKRNAASLQECSPEVAVPVQRFCALPAAHRPAVITSRIAFSSPHAAIDDAISRRRALRHKANTLFASRLFIFPFVVRFPRVDALPRFFLFFDPRTPAGIVNGYLSLPPSSLRDVQESSALLPFKSTKARRTVLFSAFDLRRIGWSVVLPFSRTSKNSGVPFFPPLKSPAAGITRPFDFLLFREAQLPRWRRSIHRARFQSFPFGPEECEFLTFPCQPWRSEGARARSSPKLPPAKRSPSPFFNFPGPSCAKWAVSPTPLPL